MSISDEEHVELTALLDGELDEQDAARVEAQVHADPRLQAELEALRDVRRHLRRHGPLKAPSGFALEVMDKVAEAPETRAREAWWRRPFGVPLEGFAAAAAALLVLSLALPTPEPTTAPATSPEGVEVGFSGGGAKIYQFPSGWTVKTERSAEEVRDALDALAAEVLAAKGGGTLTVELDASKLGDLQRALESLGTITPMGAAKPAVGDTTVTVVVTR